MEESEGAGSDVVVDVDCIRGYVCSLCPLGRRLSAYIAVIDRQTMTPMIEVRWNLPTALWTPLTEQRSAERYHLEVRARCGSAARREL